MFITEWKIWKFQIKRQISARTPSQYIEHFSHLTDFSKINYYQNKNEMCNLSLCRFIYILGRFKVFLNIQYFGVALLS